MFTLKHTPLALIILCTLAAPGCLGAIGDEDDPSVVDPYASLNSTVIDMADYVIPNCDSGGAAWQVGSEQFRVVPLGIKNGSGRLVIVKSASGDGFEEWHVAKDYLRIVSDTTWAYEMYPGGPWCDVKCGDNGGSNCQQRWNTDPSSPYNGLNPSSPWAYTRYHAPGKPDVGAAWIPRNLELPVGGSKQYTTTMEIKGADRSTCGECYVNFGTQPGQSVARTVMARRYESYGGFIDVVHLRVQSGPGAGENYYYAYGKGWVGFGSTMASAQVPSSTMPQSSCAGFQQGSICEITGGIPSPTDPPTNPPAGTCECRTDVDNYCQYPKGLPGCTMTQPGGYCDPNGDGSFSDADWGLGYGQYQTNCTGATPPPDPPDPPDPPVGSCECRSDVDNFCLYPKGLPGCTMTEPGGYCDPNGDGEFNDADWVQGYNDYHASCPGGGTTPPPPPPPSCECRTDVDNYCLYPKGLPGCDMTEPGGYCDPNGDGSFDDADWVQGYNEYHDNC